MQNLLPQYIEDHTVRRSLSQAMRRAKQIEAGSRVSPFPTVQVSNMPNGRTPSKRAIILGAAQPLLENEDDLTALDEFLKSRVTGWEAQLTPKRRIGRPSTQANGSRNPPRVCGPPTINSNISRPQTVPVGRMRPRSRAETIRQRVYTHFEL